MARRVSPIVKRNALHIMQSNGGDIQATHIRTGVPVRTLYTWRKEWWDQQFQQQTPLSQSAAKPALTATGDFKADLSQLRLSILGTIEKVLEAPPARTQRQYLDRMRALAGLAGIISKLNNVLGIDAPAPTADQGGASNC